MDDLCIGLPTTHEITKPDEGKSRRNSTGKIFSLNSGDKIPHYLRASTGSCHDHCKYGTKHEMEVKARCPIKSVPRRLPTKSPANQNLLENMIFPERKNASVIKIKHSPDSTSPLPDTCNITGQKLSEKSVDSQSSAGSELQAERNVPVIKIKHSPNTCNITKQKLSKKSIDSQSSAGSELQAERKNVPVIKIRHSLDSAILLPDTRNITKQKLSKKPSDSQSFAGSELQAERKNVPAIKIRHSLESTTLLPDTRKTTKQKLSKKPSDSQSSAGSELLAQRKTTSSTKYKSPSYSKPYVYAVPKTLKLEVSPSLDKLEVSSEKVSIISKEKSLSAKHGSSSQPKYLVVKELPSPDNSGGSSALRNSDLEIGQRTGTSLKPKYRLSKQRSSPESAGGLKGQRTSDFKIGKKGGMSKVALKKVMVPPTVSRSPRPSLRKLASLKAQKNRAMNDVSPLKNQNRIRKAKPEQVNTDEVQEKTLYVIKVETENKPLESDQNKNCDVEPTPPSSSPSPKSLLLPDSLSFSSHEGEDQDSGYTMSDTEDDCFSEDKEVDYIEKAETLHKDDKAKPRKSGMVCSVDKDGKALKFRRGKVVDLQFEANSPRRLKFRRGRVLGDNQIVKGDAQRRSFKKRGADGDTVATEAGAEKVILRHQDVQGKKDEKGLFNNVIEETASKLVEARKSKVKALVGAFETVISLQERKPSASSVA